MSGSNDSAYDKEKMRNTYNRIAADWHEAHQPDTWWVKGFDVFHSYLFPGALVLDVGCGSGTMASHFIEQGMNVFGIDISDELLAIARREVPKGEFVELDLRDVGSLDRSFDGIFAQASLLHIPKKEVSNIVRALAGRLKPGGFFYAAVKEIRAGEPDEEIKVRNDYGYEYKCFFSYFKMDELKTYFRDAGFSIVYEAIEPSGSTRWLSLVAKKP